MDKFSFFKSYYDAAKDLPAEVYKESMNALLAYVFEGKEPEGLTPYANMFFTLVKPYADKSVKLSEGGAKGGTSHKEASAKLSESLSEASAKPKPTEIRNKNIEVRSKNKEDRKENKEPEDKKDSARPRPPRHKHGEYGHVMLTDDQYQNLVNKHGELETQKAIKKVDEYCERMGKTYKNYALVLENWGFKPDKNARSGTTDKSKFTNNFHQRDYDFDSLESALLNSQG